LGLEKGRANECAYLHCWDKRFGEFSWWVFVFITSVKTRDVSALQFATFRSNPKRILNAQHHKSKPFVCAPCYNVLWGRPTRSLGNLTRQFRNTQFGQSTRNKINTCTTNTVHVRRRLNMYTNEFRRYSSNSSFELFKLCRQLIVYAQRLTWTWPLVNTTYIQTLQLYGIFLTVNMCPRISGAFDWFFIFQTTPVEIINVCKNRSSNPKFELENTINRNVNKKIK